MTKICTKCKENKSLNEYNVDNKRKDKKACYCRACSIESAKKWNKVNKEVVYERNRIWRANNKHKCQDQKLRYHFNLTLNDYNNMLQKQNNKCAICKISQDKLNHTLNVDHNHKTSKIRGLLCSSCNRAIGFLKFDETSENIYNVLEYYKKYELSKI